MAQTNTSMSRRAEVDERMAQPNTLVLFEESELPQQEPETVASSGLPPGEFVRFELQPKDAAVNLRLPRSLLGALRVRSKETGIPSQRLIRIAVERMLRDRNATSDGAASDPVGNVSSSQP